jgi:formylglycine-generating enzyme required for sulfatase activity
MLNAFCIWDGGRLPTWAEWMTAFYGGSEPKAAPWGNAPLALADIHDYAVTGAFHFGAVDDLNPTPQEESLVPGGYTFGDLYRHPGDRGTHIAPPGSKVRGRGGYGHMDLAGNVIEWLIDSRYDAGGENWTHPLIDNWTPVTVGFPTSPDCAPYTNLEKPNCQQDWTDGGYRMVGGGSWEGHPFKDGGSATAYPVGFTYHAMGGRCARD